MFSDLPLYKSNDFGNIRKFYLALGPACNMHCRHCFQEPIKSDGACFSSVIDDRVFDVVDNFIEYSVTHPYPFNKRYRQIIFWGGEPLVYWPIIQKIVHRVHNKFGLLDDNYVRFCTISNGLLLTDEMVDFFNEYNFNFGFSYDAPYPWAVRDYVPDEICERVRKLKCFLVNGSYNAYNDDLLLAGRCLRRKFPEAETIDVSARLIRNFNMSPDILDYDWDSVESNFRKLRIAAQLGDTFALKMFQFYFMPKGLGVKNKADFASTSCAIGNHRLVCTLQGKILSCNNSSDVFGTIENSLKYLNEKSANKLLTLKNPDCATCVHFDVCGAGRCPYDLRDEENRFYSCRDYYFRFFGILKKEYAKMLKPVSDEDLAWYHEQELLMEPKIEAFLQEGKRYEKEHTRLPAEMMNKLRKKG